MMGSLVMRGLLTGLLAGVLAFGFAKVFGEPQVDKAIAFEQHMDAIKGEAPEEELISRDVQASYGLFTGVVVYGSAMGGLFALVFAYAMGRVGRVGPRGLAALLALAGFVAIILVPQLKYPANPPSVGDPDTIKERTKLFFLMLAVSLAGMLAAINLARKLMARYGAWSGAISGAMMYVVIIAVAKAVFPDVNEVPADFSAVVLWQFRVAALGIQLVLWTSMGLLFGWLTERDMLRRSASAH